MSDWHLERTARHPLRDDPQGWGDPDSLPTEHEIELSKATSLKRIADRLEAFDLTPFGNQLLDIAYQAGVNFRSAA